MIPLEEVCKKAIETVKEAGKFIKEERLKFNQNAVEWKGTNDLVSYVDVTAEKILVKGLQEILPESGFLTEEGTIEQATTDYTWIIDPLDGTTNFIHGLPSFGVSVGLRFKDKIVLGIVYEPNADECFYAWKGSKAYLNEKEISVTNNKTLTDCLMATGFPINNHAKIPCYLDIVEHFIKNSRGVRRLGSAAIDLAYVAAGRFDGFYEYNLKAWDVAGGAFIVQQAGGLVTDFNKGDNWLFGQEIIVANPHIFDEVQGIVSTNWNK